jgi:hypothetical protein
MASSSTNSDPAELVASLFGLMTIPVLLVIIHGAVAGNIQCVYSAPLCFLAGGIRLKRWLGSIITGVIASAVLVGFLASNEFVTSFTNYMTSFVIWTASWGVIVIIDFFVPNRGMGRRTRTLRVRKDVPLQRRSLALTRRAPGRAGGRMGVRVRQRVAVPRPDLARNKRSGSLVAGVGRVRRVGLLVAEPFGAAACHGLMSG